MANRSLSGLLAVPGLSPLALFVSSDWPRKIERGLGLPISLAVKASIDEIRFCPTTEGLRRAHVQPIKEVVSQLIHSPGGAGW